LAILKFFGVNDRSIRTISQSYPAFAGAYTGKKNFLGPQKYGNNAKEKKKI
jgi:hypothetical protein